MAQKLLLARLARLTLAGALAAAAQAAGITVRSPSGALAVEFWIQDGGNGTGRPAYRAAYAGKPLVLESNLGFELDAQPPLTGGFKLEKVERAAKNTTWSPPYGERDRIPDRYREVTVHLRQAATGRRMQIVFRAYDEGLAIRYRFPKQAGGILTITAEKTEFAFPGGTYAWEEYGTEGPYNKVEAGSIKPNCERPLTLAYPGSIYAGLTEASLDNYPRMLLGPSSQHKNAVVSWLSGHAVVRPPFESPWRVLIAGERPGDLLERNYLVLNLNPPVALKNASWIRPGKAMRDVTLSTTNAKAIVDFAAKVNLQYVEFDSGWYGAEDFNTGDATRVNLDPRRIRSVQNHPGLNLPEVIRYARERKVGVILYVDRRQIRKQRDILFPLYEKWGVKGVKIGFIDVGPQAETAWLTETVRKAAEHHLVLDIHDQYRPTGLSRTYPNLLTQEGIRGNEHMPTAEHNATLPFTRFLAGAGDYTICYYNKRIKTTHAHQLALAVIVYSPLQFLFWYDRPSDYRGEPEVEFFRDVSTVWDETRVLDGRIGEFVTIARRRGREWFLGSITNSQSRELQIPLRFLESGRKYIAHIYEDDPGSPSRTKVAIRRFVVDSATRIHARLIPSGGQAIRLAPASENDLSAHQAYSE